MTNDTLSLAEEAIDAIVEEWHSEPTSNDALDERLGWSAAAYNAWVKDGTLPLSIQRILEALRTPTPDTRVEALRELTREHVAIQVAWRGGMLCWREPHHRGTESWQALDTPKAPVLSADEEAAIVERINGDPYLQPEQAPVTDASAKPVARAHITLEDDGPYIDLEVLDGTGLQPEHSPVDLYLRAQPDSALVEALKPFARALDEWCDDLNHRDSLDIYDHPVAMLIKLGDIRRAKAVLDPSHPDRALRSHTPAPADREEA